ncbi:MAG: 1-acyl-sn-glycerol-3-phosphate acyltransferase [Bacteroidales bacterium]|nr:1-acyl-sn-glycerol-3-phosphate acyltransferase [Bacteroidales bacterium]
MNEFDDIRPYTEEEIPAAVQRLADSEVIPAIADYLMPGVPADVLRNRIRNIHTLKEFQLGLLKDVIETLLKKTTTQFDWSGLENISDKKPFLFVSNHRDIVLDAMFLQYILNEAGQNTCQITFGSNLMSHPFVIDFGKINKMFRTERGGSPVEFYNSMMHMSSYMRHVITEVKESVWIAQRNGRTKNGIDATDPAIVKMFGMSRRDDRVISLAELNIVPVAVSYEWESCDKLKTLELYLTKKNGHYEKKPNEDLNSILTGIMQFKGHVHFHVCPRVTEEDLLALNDCSTGEFYKRVAALMDSRINPHFFLHPNNYIAHDLRSGTTAYADHYTDEQKAAFVKYMDWMNDYPDMDRGELEEIFLGIYANPVDVVSKKSYFCRTL